MENWSKDIAPTFLEQESTGRNTSTQPVEQLTVNSKGSMNHKCSKLVDEAKYEDTELPEQSSRNFQVINPYPGDGTAHCTTENSNIIEHRNNDLHYEYMTPFQVTPDINKEKTITFLMKELEILKASNKKLQEKLTKVDKEKRKLTLQLELQEKATEAQIAEKTAALVEEVYFAQRERDEAVMSRLQLANKERDEAIAQAKHMEMSLKSLENINPEENDMTLQELLNRINNADTEIAIQKNGAIIVERIYKTMERKKRITAEEMNAVIEERDAALSQCKRLEQELHHLKEQNQTSANNMRHLTAENNQERALKAKLLAMQQARETAVQQYKKLEEEIQTLRVYYSLHKSLSQEENLKDQFNHTLSTYEEALKNRENIVSITQQQNEELAAQLQQALTDRANMELELRHTMEASQAANDKVQKLERLVDVLRKKVGTGTMRTVI
ncbi:mirror-image polydactyly gene 1 protein isoform X2 [Talpa occidentalis]|uniref:mirror-image polydactyly gene 1 protein isoform X2 n=1 Tax=Talpa occidentalis TaxID=50954 RepID=UPI00188E0A97|nr:mirror-image polydactyly gene 1 protein isoform X2 [Talpa occidentalis]XP_054545903.1 mirror-image polydactyly gene 1 protein isoform X2 [Talpa occidentalis]XP_054545904.1 mirror-image polydactyly gene 1 protein isoform X2 [Talpa occidentalis]XP_054545907.1 mirror-image polydactyly gene 1 protein isoform X2 [Talpa occidentalis]XP_054545909.1 mirror-image polydactyly gene 1 protein isoform X2 [Talpa occidentalis]XP_054545910.1 mirror-image polydactyly gene 1 protein isoform X2 [Talpa occiden